MEFSFVVGGYVCWVGVVFDVIIVVVINFVGGDRVFIFRGRVIVVYGDVGGRYCGWGVSVVIVCVVVGKEMK